MRPLVHLGAARALHQTPQRHPDHPLFGTGLTTSDGALWHRQRPLLTTAWQAQPLADLVSIVTAATTAMLARWQPAAQHGQPLDLTAALENVTWTIIAPRAVWLQYPCPWP